MLVTSNMRVAGGKTAMKRSLMFAMCALLTGAPTTCLANDGAVTIRAMTNYCANEQSALKVLDEWEKNGWKAGHSAYMTDEACQQLPHDLLAIFRRTIAEKELPAEQGGFLWIRLFEVELTCSTCKLQKLYLFTWKKLEVKDVI